ncbi:MAG: hypothetical protein ACRD26_01915 [Vicinamibacterales bacterium]
MTRSRTRVAVTAALLTALTAPAAAQRGPAPRMTGLPADVLAMACAPRLTYDVPDQSLRLTGGQDSFKRRSFGPGDLVTINGGTDNGIEPGQEYFVRRLQTEANQRPSRVTPGSIRTAGWIRVYAVDDELSLATIVHTCDSMDIDDYLEPFVMPVVPKVSTEMIKPQRDNYGRILFGTDFRRSFGTGDFFLVDRGSDHGVAPGDRFVIYRDKKQAENFLYDLGEAVAVEVQPDRSTLRALVSRDAFMAGDYVALRK